MKKFLFNFLFSCCCFAVFFIPIHWFWQLSIVGFALFFKIITNPDSLFKKKNDTIRVFFGAPGAGKTTFAAFLAQKRHKQGVKVLSNVDIANTYMLDPVNDLGGYSTYFDGSGCTVIIDEATLDFDGRGFKSFSAQNRNYFSLFRHDCNEVFIFSQAVDMDKRIRDRASSCYYLMPSIIPGFISVRKIKKMICIQEETKQLCDGFEFVKFSRRLLWKRPYWKYFDTLDRNLCTHKERIWKGWRSDVPDIVPADVSSGKKVIIKKSNDKEIGAK